MDTVFITSLAAALSFLVGCFVTWLLCARRTHTQTVRALTAEATLAARDGQQDYETRLRDMVVALSNDALRASSDQFLQLAQERLNTHQQTAKSDLAALVDPLRIALDQQHEHARDIERARTQAYGSIEEQLKRMTSDQERLQQETANLVKALRQPQVRGRWGELQLRQVVELAGMSPHCDFAEQQSIEADGERMRPDMHVRLPNQRVVVVDAKVPLHAYLEALEASDDTLRLEHLRGHAKQLRSHVGEMSKRGYQDKIDGAHDFLVLFIPGEVFYHAALEHDRELLQYALSKNIILATPTTLIALLRAVAMGWREARLGEEAQRIKNEGENVYKHLKKVAEHLAELGKSIGKSVENYNNTVGSIERNLLTSARKLHEMQVSSTPILEPIRVETSIRSFNKPELITEFVEAPTTT